MCWWLLCVQSGHIGIAVCGKSPVTSKHLNMVKFYSQDFLSISSAGFGHRFSLALRACFERSHEFLKPVAYRKMEITVGFVFSNGKFSSISAPLLLLLLLSIKSQRYFFYIFCRQHLWEMMRSFLKSAQDWFNVHQVK